MKAVYRFCFNADTLIEGLRHWRKLQTPTWALWMSRLFLVFIAMILTAVTINSRAPWLALVVVFGCGYLLFLPRISDHRTRVQFRSSPYCNENITVVLSDEGFHATGEISRTSLTWQAYTRAVRFRDGFLLLQGPGVFNWLPDAALAEGKIGDIELLLRKHIANFSDR